MLLEADLPEDVDALRALVLEQARALAYLSDAKSKADARIERLQAIIEAFQRHRFGRKSEQLDPDLFELALEDIETALGSAQAARDAAVPKVRGERPARLTAERCQRISNESSRSSILRTRAVRAAAMRSTRSARMSLNASMSFPPPSVCWSPADRAMAAARARTRSCRLPRRHGSSKAASLPKH